MIKNFNKYLKDIPNLPPIVVKLDDFRKSKSKNYKQLIMIIKSDKIVYDNILKAISFDFFYFANRPRNIQNFIAITNLEFVTALATGFSIFKTVNINLFSYVVTADEFLYSNCLAMRIIDVWLGRFNKNLKDELLLSSFLQELSKPIISLAINKNKLTDQFLNEIIMLDDVSKAEEKIVGFTSARVTANILKNWQLSHNLIFPIAFCKDLASCPEPFRLKAIILGIVKDICNPREPLNQNAIEKALIELTIFELDCEVFQNAIDSIKESIKNNS